MENKEQLIQEAIKRGLTPTNLKNIYCLFDFDNEVNQEYYDKLGYYYYEAEYDRLWIQNGSFLDICIYHNSQWASFKEETPKTDSIVESVVNQFKERSKRGIEKYGTTLQENNTDDFLQHLKEELMDAILYIQKLQSMKK